MDSRIRYRNFHIKESLFSFGDLLFQWDWNVPKYLLVDLLLNLLSESVADLIFNPYSAAQASPYSSNRGRNPFVPQLCLNFWLNFICHGFEIQ